MAPMARAAALLLITVLAAGPSRAQEPELDAVLARAAEYVGRYQRELGNVIAEERYVQVADGRFSRTLRSDLLVLSTPNNPDQWMAFRDVIEVDGTPVEDRQQRLEQLFLETPTVGWSLWQTLAAESARFNIGGIKRTVNVPTMALQLLSASDQPRLSFRKDGEARINDAATWRIEFEEREGPTMIRDGLGRELYSHGTVWIEPTTGRVARTTLETDDRTINLEIDIDVRYEEEPRLAMLVPVRMTERYLVRLRRQQTSQLARRTIEVSCEATYSNFRRFEVEVDFELTPPGVD